MYETAIEILKKISDLGYQAYIIGGYSRNKYLGLNSKDIDICTNAPLDVINDNFEIIENNSRYGSNVIKENEYLYEITLFRKDKYEDSRYPDIIFIDDLEIDLQRRDFTINTLCIDKDGNYLDIIGAIDDLNKKIIKCVINSEISLKQDPLRILRAVRLSVDLDLKIDDELYNNIKKYGYLIETLSKNKINEEINKVINKSKLDNLLLELDLYKYLK